jgi:Zn-dependent protease with chaperone function
MSGRWADHLSQSIVHALIAALAVEALLRIWRVALPGERLAFRLLALAQPLLVTPLLVELPVRADEGFHDRWALFAGRHWEDVGLLGLSFFQIFVGAMALAGLGLFLLDLWPLLRSLRRPRRQGTPVPEALQGELRELAGAAGLSVPPPLRLLPEHSPSLYCAGVRRAEVVLSAGTLDLLDPAERRAALAHELAHLARRDPLVSWGLMAVRALQIWNPVVQVLARAMAREAERRADDAGAALAGDRLALASALLRLHRATGGGTAGRFDHPLAEPLRRARSRDIELRCRRLLEAAPGRSPLCRLRIGLCAVCLPALLFLVA